MKWQLFDRRMPLVTLLLHAFMALVMDLDSPESSRNRYLVVMEALMWNIGVQGCLQPIAAVIVTVVFCPIISFLILTGEYDASRISPRTRLYGNDVNLTFPIRGLCAERDYTARGLET